MQLILETIDCQGTEIPLYRVAESPVLPRGFSCTPFLIPLMSSPTISERFEVGGLYLFAVDTLENIALKNVRAAEEAVFRTSKRYAILDLQFHKMQCTYKIR